MAFVQIAISLVVGVIAFCHFYWLHHKKKNRSVEFVPGDIPIIGHAKMLADRKYFRKMKPTWMKQYNKTVGFYLMSHRLVYTSDLSIIEGLLASSKPALMKKGYFYKGLEKFLGFGLVTSTGDLWKKRRRMITPTFHFDILKEFSLVMDKRSKEFADTIQTYCDKGETFDIQATAKSFAISVICESAMGITLSISEISNGELKALYENALSLSFKRFLNPIYASSDFIYSLSKNGSRFFMLHAKLRDLVKQIIEERITYRIEERNRKEKDSENPVKDQDKEHSSNFSKRRIFIDVLLDSYEKKEITIEGIIDEVTTFVNAGYETVAMTLAWCLYSLGRNQAKQEKLHVMIAPLGNEASSEEFKNVKYLDWVIKETLRLHPTIPRFSRMIEDGTEIAGRVFPACTLIVDNQPINHDPEIWSDPHAFIPERFERFDETRGKESSFHFTPFSAGPRNCIGQKFATLELRSVLVHLVRKFRFVSSQGESELNETFDGININEGGLILKAEHRD
ncbi:cytochrome P450 4V2-like [Clytia hemisphaerica]|uniref:Cytochrome P450 n=1 Tax=Clytia hemisphaerica TaxID=252671 RepID=A0A7M5TPV1_9CNID